MPLSHSMLTCPSAIKFSRDSIRKEVILTVSLNRLSSEQKLVVSIQDYGCGISAAGQKRLFAKFAQGSPRTAVHYGGSGSVKSDMRCSFDLLIYS